MDHKAAGQKENYLDQEYVPFQVQRTSKSNEVHGQPTACSRIVDGPNPLLPVECPGTSHVLYVFAV